MADDELYRVVLENFPDGVIIADRNGDILFVNSAAEKIRHISKEEKIGRNVLECHQEASREKVKRALAFLKEKQSTFKRMVVDSNAGKIYENVYQAIKDKDAYLGMVVVSRDITEKQRVEQVNLDLNQKLKLEIAGLTDQLYSLFFESLTALVNTLEAKDIYTNGAEQTGKADRGGNGAHEDAPAYYGADPCVLFQPERSRGHSETSSRKIRWKRISRRSVWRIDPHRKQDTGVGRHVRRDDVDKTVQKVA